MWNPGYAAPTAQNGVSMKSGLEDRNNFTLYRHKLSMIHGLNEVRPGRPEQCKCFIIFVRKFLVSMKSGLEDRNNGSPQKAALARNFTSTCELSAPPGPIKPLC